MNGITLTKILCTICGADNSDRDLTLDVLKCKGCRSKCVISKEQFVPCSDGGGDFDETSIFNKSIPLFFMIDTSQTMLINNRYISINHALRTLASLLKDLERSLNRKIQVRVITFGGKGILWKCGNNVQGASTQQFSGIELTSDECTGNTPTAKVISELQKCLDMTVYKDYLNGSCSAPLVLLLSDGESDSGAEFYTATRKLHNSEVGKVSHMIAIGIETEDNVKATNELMTFGREAYKNCKSPSQRDVEVILSSVVYERIKSPL